MAYKVHIGNQGINYERVENVEYSFCSQDNYSSELTKKLSNAIKFQKYSEDFFFASIGFLVALLFIPAILPPMENVELGYAYYLLFVIGLIVLCIIMKLISKANIIKIDYDIEDVSYKIYQTSISVLEKLKDNQKCWSIPYEISGKSQRTNGGASRSNVLKPLYFNDARITKYFRLNITPFIIHSQTFSLMLLPDVIFVLQGQNIRIIQYDDFDIKDLQCVNFIEHGQICRDSEVIGATWQYVNKDGSPDRRFKNNRKLPICKYGRFTLHSSCMQMKIVVSNYKTLNQLYKLQTYKRVIMDAYRKYDSAIHQDTTNSRDERSKKVIIIEQQKLEEQQKNIIDEHNKQNKDRMSCILSILCSIIEFWTSAGILLRGVDNVFTIGSILLTVISILLFVITIHNMKLIIKKKSGVFSKKEIILTFAISLINCIPGGLFLGIVLICDFWEVLTSSLGIVV